MSTAHLPDPSVPTPAPPAATGFSRAKSLEELAREQGVVPVERAEDLLGQGQDLWDDGNLSLKGTARHPRADTTAP